jgi:hypothetical protein
MICSGCTASDIPAVTENPSLPNSEKPIIDNSAATASAQPDVQIIDGVTYVNIAESDPYVLSSNITLAQLGNYIDYGTQYALKDLGDGYYMSIWDAPDFEDYQYESKGIQLLRPLDEFGLEKNYISAIELDPDMFIFYGVNKNMNFSEIQECIASCDIIKVESELPEVVSYELRYDINGVKMVFFAWDERGAESFNVSIVKEFGPVEKYTRITTEQLDAYFSLSKDQIIEKLGDTIKYNTQIEEHDTGKVYDEYKCGSVRFSFEGDILSEINLPANYEIDGARWGMDFDTIIQILGENEVKIGEGEDGYYYTLDYIYNNFKLNYFGEFSDDRPVPFILGVD